MWDLIFQPGIEPVPHPLEGQSLNHFTTRDIPRDFILVEYAVIRFDLSRALYETTSRTIKRKMRMRKASLSKNLESLGECFHEQKILNY